MMRFNSIKAGFNLENPAFFKSWLKNVVVNEGDFKIGELQYIFCDDVYLHSINASFLKHDTYTDIITFPSSENINELISGEIYISVDRVKENAKIYGHTFYKELSRVLVHGLLHLLGYEDETDEQKQIMRQREDYYLNLQPLKNS